MAGLVAKNLVKSEPSHKHKRQSDHYLTESGQHLLEDIEDSAGDRGLANFVELIGPEGRTYLEKLAGLVNNDAGHSGPLEPRFSLRVASARDLAWLIGRFGSGANEGEGVSDLLDRMTDLGMHLHHDLDRKHRWVLVNWGERVGGAVMSHDTESTTNAWIKLLYVAGSNREALTLLIRECVNVAIAQTYEWLQIKIQRSDHATREVVSQIGFHPIGIDEPLPAFGKHPVVAYGMQLRPLHSEAQ